MAGNIQLLICFFLLTFSLKSCTKPGNDDNYAPEVMQSDPADGAVNIPTDQVITVQFTEKIVLLSGGRITLNDLPVEATTDARSVVIRPSLKPDTEYTLIIHEKTISDVAGNYAGAVTLRFTTKALQGVAGLDTVLATPQASAQAVALFRYLRMNYGTRVLSGTMANHSTNIDEAIWVNQQTGKWPKIVGFDFIDHPWPDQNWVKYSAPFTLGKAYHDNGGIVTLMWHWRDPLTKSGAFYTANTGFNVARVSDPASDEYKAMMVDIDIIAGYLREFRNAGIPILWRPLHEASGKWFWWGARGPEACKTLWKLMFDRLVNHHQLDNLIWVWTSDEKADAPDWYPGHDYVDIIGMDIYPGENQHGSQYAKFNAVTTMLGRRKMLALTECGSVPDPALMKQQGDMWAWFMTWNGDFTRSDRHNGAEWWKKLMGNELVVSRD